MCLWSYLQQERFVAALSECVCVFGSETSILLFSEYAYTQIYKTANITNSFT